MLNIFDVAIIGGGPAGLTAGIYSARAKLKTLLFEGEFSDDRMPGGQLMFTTDIENYPGFKNGVKAFSLMSNMRKQTVNLGVDIIDKDVVRVTVIGNNFKIEDSSNTTIIVKSIIIASGSKTRWLGLDNEKRLRSLGGGVSSCAVCDGALPIFRDKELVVIGGGDSAFEEALYLSKFASKVHLIHRRKTFKANKMAQDRLANNKRIFIHTDFVVQDILGDKFVDGVLLRNVTNNSEKIVKARGVFVAIGHIPCTDFLKGVIELDNSGYIVRGNSKVFYTQTSVEGIFAAGDVIDHVYKQAITSAGAGCMAALDCERWLSSKV